MEWAGWGLKSGHALDICIKDEGSGQLIDRCFFVIDRLHEIFVCCLPFVWLFGYPLDHVVRPMDMVPHSSKWNDRRLPNSTFIYNSWRGQGFWRDFSTILGDVWRISWRLWRILQHLQGFLKDFRDFWQRTKVFLRILMNFSTFSGIFERFWGILKILGDLWRIFEGFWGIFEPFWGISEGLWGIFEGF